MTLQTKTHLSRRALVSGVLCSFAMLALFVACPG